MSLTHTFITTGDKTGRRLVFIPLDDRIYHSDVKRLTEANRAVKHDEEVMKIKVPVIGD